MRGHLLVICVLFLSGCILTTGLSPVSFIEELKAASYLNEQEELRPLFFETDAYVAYSYLLDEQIQLDMIGIKGNTDPEKFRYIKPFAKRPGDFFSLSPTKYAGTNIRIIKGRFEYRSSSVLQNTFSGWKVLDTELLYMKHSQLFFEDIELKNNSIILYLEGSGAKEFTKIEATFADRRPLCASEEFELEEISSGYKITIPCNTKQMQQYIDRKKAPYYFVPKTLVEFLFYTDENQAFYEGVAYYGFPSSN